MEEKYQINPNQRVVFVGLVCVDVVNIIQKFPKEDEDRRCLDCFWQRGGNASNSSTVFTLLGGNVEFFGTLAGGAKEHVFLKEDFRKFNINTQRAIVFPDTFCPTSTVILSKETGTRTILHTNKGYPELKLAHLQDNYDLSTRAFGWIHFEGRDNAKEITRMMQYINKHNECQAVESPSVAPVIVSLEAEKVRFIPWLEKLDMWSVPDVMFVSKDIAIHEGYCDMETAATAFYKRLKPGAVLICAWGDKGAAAISAETGIVTSPAYPPATVVDTLGAGDTFNAATIYCLSSGKSLHDSITFGCKVAGAKCGIQGYGDLRDAINSFY